jgi:hypothetical protein
MNEEDQRSEIFAGICGCVHRLYRAHHVLSAPQRLALAEELRGLADQIDFGRPQRPPSPPPVKSTVINNFFIARRDRPLVIERRHRSAD